ncbi:MAG TPA: Gfo/Idh/MocA family oxidoreductase [Planctomycetaceae bacterium]|jgi:predicted dehydrogenase|nr:Gfo/Idh/MocA family oxidoreductase [Planctomycetaceae bacterium]
MHDHQSASRGTSRRQFLGTAAGTLAAGALGGPLLVSRGARAAGGTGTSDRIRVAAIGVGGRASLLLQQLPESAEIVGLCDCNVPRAEAFKAKQKAAWPVVQDYRRLLDRKDVDAVIVATGEFQRVVPCIHACQAGKDVYAEKPLTLYIHEGRALVNAVRHYNRVLQVGSQQRSMAMNRVACELVRSGGLGKVHEVRAINYTGPESSPAQPFPAQPVPKGLDWNVWLNQAAWREFNPTWMGWMRWRDFSGGEMTNWGAHGVDQIQWGLGMDGTGPTEIRPLTSGTNGQVAMRYANGVEVNFVLEQGHGPMGGAVFICEKGKLEINRNKFASNPPEIAEELRKHLDVAEEERKWSDNLALWQARWHMQNWLDCIRSRNQPVADVEIGHRSISVCHLANIARTIGRPLRWDPTREQFLDDDAANQLLDRPRRKGFELPTV